MNGSPTPQRFLSRGPQGLAFALFLAVVVSSSLIAQSASSGVVPGRVINAATQPALVGAAVTVEADARVTAFTEADGTFRLEHVPPGEQALLVDYTGLDRSRTSVRVTPGQSTPVLVKMNAGIYR